METTVRLVGLDYLPYRHTFNVNIRPHVCEGLEAIWAYIACSLFVQLP